VKVIYPSPEQVHVLVHAEFGHGHAMVSSAAGGGKTFVLKAAAKKTRGRNLFCSFNTHNVEAIQGALPWGWDALTIHGLGQRALGSLCPAGVGVNALKYRNLASCELSRRGLADDDGSMARTVDTLVRYAHVTLTDPTAIDPEDSDPIRSVLQDVVRAGELAARAGEASFTDMLHLPLKLRLPLKQYDNVFVDECQDLSVAQRKLVLASVAPGGRLLMVGDERQAIQAFAGADTSSIARMVEETNAQTMTLATCYRCPVSHIELARSIVSHIWPADGAIEGTIDHIGIADLPRLVTDGDLILCRITSPLVDACIELNARGLDARVKGVELGEGIVALLRRVNALYRPGVNGLEKALDSHLAMQSLALGAAGKDRVKILYDQARCLNAITRAKRPGTLPELEAAITAMFSAETSAIRLATIHGAKGSEADRVFILDSPPRKPRLDWMQIQERNLNYVGLTRARKALYFVEGRHAIA
jgi:DNA helicase-2/ATP-dependent DNA helicase PcrA